jgi:RNA ligase (TIGR02306 family)
MSDRKMAYIATISDLGKIPDKDRIVYASLKDLGWQVIVDTSHNVGDKVIYVEIDSILPVKPEYEFLRKRCFSEKYNGFVIKGMKMAGLVSYGLVLPAESHANKPDGFDMTGILDIRKREDDVPDLPEHLPKSKLEKFVDWLFWKLGLKKRKKVGVADGWLSFVSKTDETRIENLSYLFNEEFKGTPVYVTTKLDGQSATFAYHKGYFFMASRNVILYRQKIKPAMKELNSRKERQNMDNFRRIASRYDLPRAMFLSKTPVVIQGELCGPGIQKNPMGLPDTDLFVFNVYFPFEKIKGVYVSWDKIKELCDALTLKTVPLIERRLFDWPDKAALKDYAKGKYENGKDREGIVIRYDSGAEPIPGPLKGMSNMFSFKVINDDYILGK